jgi:hypothetical protein
MKVIDKFTGEQLNDQEILNEVNRDRSDTWQSYTYADLKNARDDVLNELDQDFYTVEA